MHNLLRIHLDREHPSWWIITTDPVKAHRAYHTISDEDQRHVEIFEDAARGSTHAPTQQAEQPVARGDDDRCDVGAGRRAAAPQALTAEQILQGGGPYPPSLVEQVHAERDRFDAAVALSHRLDKGQYLAANSEKPPTTDKPPGPPPSFEQYRRDAERLRTQLDKARAVVSSIEALRDRYDHDQVCFGERELDALDVIEDLRIALTGDEPVNHLGGGPDSDVPE